MPVLVDSSLWVHHLRRSGDLDKRQRVNDLLKAGQAAWCAAVRLELWRGVTNDAERRTLRKYEALLQDIAITSAVWERAIHLADKGRALGVTVPLADVLIYACAREHGIGVAHDDVHFAQLEAVEEATADSEQK